MSAYIRDIGNSPKYKIKKNDFKRSNRCCAECGRFTKLNDRTIDHIIPASTYKGTAWDKANWQILCVTCHRRKTTNENKIAIQGNTVRLTLNAPRL